jgi:hypothetical protein
LRRSTKSLPNFQREQQYTFYITTTRLYFQLERSLPLGPAKEIAEERAAGTELEGRLTADER